MATNQLRRTKNEHFKWKEKKSHVNIGKKRADVCEKSEYESGISLEVDKGIVSIPLSTLQEG